MSGEKKSGLRLATVIGAAMALVSLAVILVVGVNSAKPKYPETAEFLVSKFVDAKFLEGFTPGEPEYGFSLEALAQLSQSRVDISTSRMFLLEKSAEYLYSESTPGVQPGLAGKFLFASKVTGADNSELLKKVIDDLLGQISNDGTLQNGSTFDYSWAILGLRSQNLESKAALLAKHLATLAREDGGFGFDQTEFTTSSSVDATAMAIQALVAAGQELNSNSAVDRAIEFLNSNRIDGDHFVAFEAEDVNGTALALMALKAATGEIDEPIHSYLVRQIRPDGGIGSPWVEESGDQFATAQGYLALEGKSYLDLIRD
ncbi:MAG: hypothetical protein ACKOXT_03970 [Actinomycetota bacterium]